MVSFIEQLKGLIFRHKSFLICIIVLVLIKVVWVVWGCWNIGSNEKEKNDILQRKNWLVDKIVVEPRQLLSEMPGGLGLQFQGEWALYSCSMLAKALSNISVIYPETKQESINTIDSLIQIVESPELRLYDKMRWREDPLDSIAGDKSHISYLSHLAWMIGNYLYRNTHQSYCYPLDMLHRAADCIVVPKMLAANDTISTLQLLDLVDHIGLSAEEIKIADSHGCASICFAMECGADVVTAALTTLNDNNLWSSLIKHNGSITRHSDRWNDLIGTLLIAETRYAEAVETFETVSDQYSSNIYDTGKNPFALQFISDPLCRSGETKMQSLSPNHKKWFAQRMIELKQTMDNANRSEKERAMAGIDYYTGIANSVYPCWSLTRYGEGSSPFFPYQIPNQPIGKRATEIIHDYMCEEYFTVDQPSKFNRSYLRLRKLRQESIKKIKEQTALLNDNEAAEILMKIGQYLIIKHHYADTDIANRLKSSCDRWSDW